MIGVVVYVSNIFVSQIDDELLIMMTKVHHHFECVIRITWLPLVVYL